MAEKISLRSAVTTATIPLCWRRWRSNSAMSAGGDSFVVKIGHKTARKDATAPILNEYGTVSGMPLAVLPVTPEYLKMYGSALARVAPTPMKKLCITKPTVRWSGFNLSATKARNGSMLMLMLASKIHRKLAAILTLVESGMTNNARLDKSAPTKK